MIEGETAPQPQSHNSFYESTNSLLRWLMVLLSFAMDLGAGIAAHRALQLSEALGENSAQLARDLAVVMGMTAVRRHDLQTLWHAYFEASRATLGNYSV